MHPAAAGALGVQPHRAKCGDCTVGLIGGWVGLVVTLPELHLRYVSGRDDKRYLLHRAAERGAFLLKNAIFP